MKRLLIYITLFFLTNQVVAEMVLVSPIPLSCSDTKKSLRSINVPDHFKLNPYQALIIASKTHGNINIKKCGSKLEQVIYRDNDNYYFFNSLEYVNPSQLYASKLRKPIKLPKHIVILNARTGITIK